MKKFCLTLGIFALGTLFTVNAFAVNYDENSPCYQNCLKVRMACRKACENSYEASKQWGNPQSKSQMYQCRDKCDPPFNNVCIKKCPTLPEE